MQFSHSRAKVNANRRNGRVKRAKRGHSVTFSSKSIGIIVFFAVSFGTAYAQVCKEPLVATSKSPANLNCDMRYRDTVVTCDKSANDTRVLGTRPACPKKPMPMIDTPNKSYITDYSPYLYIYPRDASDPSRPYAGSYALGTPGDASRTFQLFGNTAAGTKRLASCTAQLKLPSNPSGDEDWAKFIRLQMDNCTNQYILNAALYPYQMERKERLPSMEDPSNSPEKQMDLESECQPLRTFQEGTNEYSASTYLKTAWKKLLENPQYRKSKTSTYCIPCTSFDMACDREPHLPCGIKIDNPLPPPDPFPEVRSSSLSTIKYEGIIDPTHPFSPRWDYALTDRDYSYESKRWLGQSGAPYSNVESIYRRHDTYMSSPQNTIYCAGLKKADKEKDAKAKADKLVEVDVMEFRRAAFERDLEKRVDYNATCKSDMIGPIGGGDFWGEQEEGLIYVAPLSWCFNITGFSYVWPFIYATGKDCWKCYGLNGKVDDEKKHPPCTTNYVGKDHDMTGVMFGGAFNSFSLSPQCGKKMQTVCSDLRKPLTMINRLKMRYHNENDKKDSKKDNNVLTEGVPEGMKFSDYFGNHMPYPRLWDTGQPLQKTPSGDKNAQPPLDTTGQYTTIVGVGREAASKKAAGSTKNKDGEALTTVQTDQRCKTMGWGGDASFGGVKVRVPDALTSWTELKLYQTRTLRNVGLNCMGRYEKVFKSGSAENMMMIISGGEWQKAIIQKCDRDTNGRTQNCEPMTLKEYVDAGSPKDDDSVVYMKQLEADGWPNSWRGYLSAKVDGMRFPKFGGNSGSTQTGLENAELGDIVMMPKGPADGSTAKDTGLPKLAFVIELRLPNNSDCSSQKNCYVKVLEPDNGKWPDVCGTTDTWGEMKTRYYFKPGHFPNEAAAELKRINSTSDCKETKLSHCEFSKWDDIEIYRIRSDIRTGCTKKDKAADCTKDQ